MEQTYSPEFGYAGFGRRLGAQIFDAIIIWIFNIWFMSMVLGIDFVQLGNPDFKNSSKFIILNVFSLLFAFLYSVVFWTYRDGATLGKKFMGVKVVKTNGKPISVIDAVLRWLGYVISFFCLFLGYIWIIFDKRKQGWHDKIAGTVAVKTDNHSKVLKFIGIVLIFLLFWTGILAYSIYKIADQKFDDPNLQKKLQTREGGLAKELFEKDNPSVDEADAHIKASQDYIKQAINLSKKQSFTTADKEQLTKIINKAIDEAQAATEILPDYANTWENLGSVYRSLIGYADGSDEKAIQAYKKAVELNKNHVGALLGIAGIYYKGENYQMSLFYLKKAEEIDPEYANIYYNLGYTYKQLGENENSLAAFRKTLELLKDDDPVILEINQEINSLQ